MMNEKLLLFIDSQVHGIVWIDDGPLNTDLIDFDTLNYLFDGLLTSNSEVRNDHSFNFFQTQNFNRDLFLLFSTETDDYSSKIKQFLKLIENKKYEDSELVLMTKRDIYKKLIQDKKIKDIFSHFRIKTYYQDKFNYHVD